MTARGQKFKKLIINKNFYFLNSYLTAPIYKLQKVLEHLNISKSKASKVGL